MAAPAPRRTRPPTYLAIDLGASSGRAVLGTLTGATMGMQELHRFPTPLIEAAGHLYWDIDAIWREVTTSIARALEVSPDLRAVSVDSWAVDYVPLDDAGAPLRRPYAYRDPRTKGRLEQLVQRLGADALYARTGIQFLPFNTLPQVVADLADEPELVSRTARRLTIADYIQYRLCGVVAIERTMASTTQAFDVAAGVWADDVIRAAGDEPRRWPRVVPPGTVLGSVIESLVPTGTVPPLVVASCSHDTAAAVAAVPAAEGDSWAFVSSGTWSLVGAELHAPILSPAARAAGFTNEVGLDDTIRFLKNRTGMWVLEEWMREQADAGARPDYETLMAEAAAAAPAGMLDLDEPPFAERGGMDAKLREACARANVPLPTTRGALVRLVLDSLAAGYARTLRELETLTGRRIDTLHVVGGGARNNLLNALTADACQRRVVAGPTEATTLGNLLVQARTLDHLPGGTNVRAAARASSRLTEHTPATRPTILSFA